MKELKVVANPYCAVDADGVPQGVAGLPGTNDAYIGARLDDVPSRKTGKRRFYFPAAKDGSVKVVTVQVTTTDVLATMVRAIQAGSVIAADEATAKLASVKEFLPVESALARQEARALDAYRAYHGKEAVLKPVPTEPTIDDLADLLVAPDGTSSAPSAPAAAPRDPNQLTNIFRITES